VRLSAPNGRLLGLGAAVLAFAGGATAAYAQSVNIGGQVDDEIQLSISQPTGFATFPKVAGDHVYTMTIDALVTTTTDNQPVSLSVADGGNGTGAPVPSSQLGRLVNATGTSVLPLPLQVSASTQSTGATGSSGATGSTNSSASSGTASGNLVSLDTAVAPTLAFWPEPVSSAPVTVELSQEINGIHGLTAGPYTKEVLVTLSSFAP